MKNNLKEQIPPSLDLAFDWVKGVLYDQGHNANILDRKGTTIFSAATVVLGVGVAAGILVLKDIQIIPLIFGGLTLISYGWVAGFFFEAGRLRRFQTLDNPIIIRQWYLDMSPSQFKMEILSHLEDSYQANERTLHKKANAIQGLIGSTTAEVVLLILALAFTL